MKNSLSKRKVFYGVMGVIIFIYALTVLLPLYYMIVNSLKRMDDFLENGGWSFPVQIYFKNYLDVFKIGGSVSFGSMFINSAIFTVCSVLISTATSTMTAYVLAKFRFRGRNFLVSLGVGALFIPDLGSGSVIYKLFLDLNIMDSWFVLVKYAGAFGMNFLMLFSLFSTVAKAYTEAAQLDGAGELTIFLKIAVPMASGMICAMMIINAIGSWNDYYTPYMYLPSLKTLSVGLQELAGTISQFDRPKLFAGMVVGMMPVLLIFVIFHDTIIKNTAAGGIKG